MSGNELNSSSLIGLKAELYRKREEARETQKRPKLVDHCPRKPPIWARSREKSDKVKKKLDSCNVNNDTDLLAKSRHQLEAKTRLYEELTQSSLPSLDQDDENGYLVDFERKVFERNDNETIKRLEMSRSADVSSDEDDWVEYTDAFGRSRRCLREDLPRHLERNEDLRQDLNRKEATPTDDPVSESEQTEGQMPSAKAEPIIPSKPNIHYADVQHEEVRTHGVGFFQFAADEATRQAQLKELKQMRKITEDSRSRKEQIKEKRKAQMELRLAKVKERRMLCVEEKAEVCEPTDEEKQNKEAEAIAATLSILRAEVEESKEKHQRRNPCLPRREWDRGKAMMTAEKYIEERRNERHPDFAPPSYQR